MSVALVTRSAPYHGLPDSAGQDIATIVVGDEPDWPQAAQEFTSVLTLALIRRHVVKLHLFHAASLMDPATGGVVALVGPSGRGKTTASRALARAGWIYLSDETCAIDPDTLEVVPYPKPLSVIEEPDRPKVQIAASTLGMRVVEPGNGPAPRLAHIVILDRDGDESGTGPDDSSAERVPTPPPPEGLDRAPLLTGLQALAEQSSGLARTPDGLLRLAELATRVGGLLSVRYREASELPRLLGDLEEWAAPEAAEDWHYFPPAEPAWDRPEAQTADVEAPATTDGTSFVARSPHVCGIGTEEGILLMHPYRTVVYSRLGADLWIEAGAGRSRRELEEKLSEFYGPPPEGAFERVLHEIIHDHAVIGVDGRQDTTPRNTKEIPA